ncbi:MAG: hypothetical protein Kow00108_22350 [Calditrichia bacterium]
MITIKSTDVQDAKLLKLEGKLLGGPEAQQLLEVLQELIDQKVGKVVLNLEDVERMNSSGLGILISAFTSFKKNGGDLRISSPNPTVYKLLEITKLTSVFQLYSSDEDALV